MGPPHQLLHSQQVNLVAPLMLLAALAVMVVVAVHLEVVSQMVEVVVIGSLTVNFVAKTVIM